MINKANKSGEENAGEEKVQAREIHTDDWLDGQAHY
jgi:hypothetical protein